MDELGAKQVEHGNSKEGDGGDEGNINDKDDADEWRKQRRGPAWFRSLRRQDSTSSGALSNPFFTPNFDSDDAGFVDTPVSAQLDFTGMCAALGRSITE